MAYGNEVTGGLLKFLLHLVSETWWAGCLPDSHKVIQFSKLERVEIGGTKGKVARLELTSLLSRRHRCCVSRPCSHLHRNSEIRSFRIAWWPSKKSS